MAFYLLATAVHSTLDTVLAIGALGAAFTVVSGTIGGIVAWRFAERRQRTWIRALLDDEMADGTVSEKLNVLAGPRKDRRRYLRSVKAARGKAAARQAGHVLDAQIDLAAAITATGNVASPEVEHARSEVRRVRALAPA